MEAKTPESKPKATVSKGKLKLPFGKKPTTNPQPVTVTIMDADLTSVIFPEKNRSKNHGKYW